MNEAVLLTILLTVFAGSDPDAVRDIARRALVDLGCADAVIVMQPGPAPKIREVRGRCLKLGKPAPGTPEAGTKPVIP